MNKIVYQFLLARDKFLPKMHSKQRGFTYSACGSFTKNKERIQNFRETGDTSYIYKNELDKACFQHDIAYGDFKDLARRVASDKVLTDKAFNFAKNPKYDSYQRGLISMVYNFFDEKSASLPDKSVSDSGVNIPLEFNEQLDQLLENFKKRTVYSGLKNNIWVADLADVRLLNKFNKGFKF